MTREKASDIVFSMRKSIILLILLLFSFEAYPFWIWSPKTQEWKNPKYSALATPYLQYKQALKYFEEDEFKEAYEEFKKLLVNYPDAKEAAEAQYYLARCLEKFDKPYDAFLEYQKLINSYPNSQRINEVVEREYNIGEYFLNKEHKEWLGLSLYDFVEHPSIQIFGGIVDNVPYSEYAHRAQYKLGMILFQLGRYEESREAFQKVIDNYSDSEWAAPAKYQLALATSQAFPGADYDSSYLKEATSRLDEFIKDHPEAKISAEAEDQLTVLRNKEARKVFDTGQFYENQDQYKSGVIYYKKVVKNYPDSDYYDLAVERIEELEELIRRNITKSELKKKEKREVLITKKEEKIRVKQELQDQKAQKREEKIDRKKKAKDEKIAKKQERRDAKIQKREEKIVIKQKRKDEKNQRKEEKNQAKINRKEEARARKRALRDERIVERKDIWAKKAQKREEKIDRKKKAKDEKIAKKQRRKDEKRQLKEEKVQSKLKRKEKARVNKKAAKREKIRKKQERRDEKISRKKEKIKKNKELKEKKRQAKLKKKEEVRARKKALKEEKLRKKQEKKEKRKKKFWFW